MALRWGCRETRVVCKTVGGWVTPGARREETVGGWRANEMLVNKSRGNGMGKEKKEQIRKPGGGEGGGRVGHCGWLQVEQVEGGDKEIYLRRRHLADASIPTHWNIPERSLVNYRKLQLTGSIVKIITIHRLKIKNWQHNQRSMNENERLVEIFGNNWKQWHQAQTFGAIDSPIS